jgi:hypothetical protein
MGGDTGWGLYSKIFLIGLLIEGKIFYIQEMKNALLPSYAPA